MRTVVLSMAAVLVLAGPAAAQNPPMRRQALQQQVVERFLTNYRAQAALTDDQFERLRETLRASFEARNALAQRERETFQELESQMRPGVAADEARATDLLDDLVRIQAERAERARTEQQLYTEFLSPVQRGQLTLAWQRLQMQMERVRSGQGGPRMNIP